MLVAADFQSPSGPPDRGGATYSMMVLISNTSKKYPKDANYNTKPGATAPLTNYYLRYNTFRKGCGYYSNYFASRPPQQCHVKSAARREKRLRTTSPLPRGVGLSLEQCDPLARGQSIRWIAWGILSQAWWHLDVAHPCWHLAEAYQC